MAVTVSWHFEGNAWESIRE